MARPKTDHRPPGWTLYRHILQEVTAPSLLALSALTIIFLTDDMLQFSDLVMNRGLGAGAVASTALYRLIPAFTWVLPFSVLMGSLIALGRLGADRELLIIEASGISAPRLLPPILLFAALAVVSIVAFRSKIYEKLRGNPPEIEDGVLGEVAIALEAIDAGGHGRVELRGSTWTAQNSADAPIAAGSRARVQRTEGLTLFVRPEQ